MPRDYANRGRPAAKKKATRRPAAKKSPKQTASAPWFMILLVVALLVGFGYFLYSIKGGAQQQASEPPETSPTKNKTVSTPKSDLPEKPEERWTFIEELENKEVEVDVPDAPEKTRPYLMQCGSFRTERQADELKARIAFQGLSSEVRRTEGTKGVWFKVVLGPYDTKRAAEKHRHVMQRGDIQGCQIWHW
ncbi:SPOR domain-containing protein [Echinimonas agarilytica]|uniref:SPOR domain-containing protein n=1 Tax=Echinimonas agarilytica TaxID=1215918 RepID=A0AA42B6D4_9GAMM|nr:SPOR domain-containing protein [Echinimonas agarilytica]MCM2678311.1 SPOR domain-containing protein [Echinimonas agarilytica]